MNKLVLTIGIVLLVTFSAAIFVVSRYLEYAPPEQKVGPAAQVPQKTATSTASSSFVDQYLQSISVSSSLPSAPPPASDANLTDIPKLPLSFTWSAGASATIPDALSYDNYDFEADTAKFVQKNVALPGTAWTTSRTVSCSEDAQLVIQDFQTYYDNELASGRGWEPGDIQQNNLTFRPFAIDEPARSAFGYLQTDGVNLREVLLVYSVNNLSGCPSKMVIKVFVSDIMPLVKVISAGK